MDLERQNNNKDIPQDAGKEHFDIKLPNNPKFLMLEGVRQEHRGDSNAKGQDGGGRAGFICPDKIPIDNGVCHIPDFVILSVGVFSCQKFLLVGIPLELGENTSWEGEMGKKFLLRGVLD